MFVSIVITQITIALNVLDLSWAQYTVEIYATQRFSDVYEI